MKINKIQAEKIVLFQQKRTYKNHLNENINNNSNDLPHYPKGYQTVNNIYFSGNAKFLAYPVKNENNKISSIKIYIPSQNKDSCRFELDEADSVKILTTKTGTIDNLAIGLIAELFSDYYKIAKSKFEKEKAFLKSILEDNNETYLINARQNTYEAFEKTLNNDSENYLEFLFSNIQDTRYKQELALVYLELIEEKIAQSAMTCVQEALMVLKLSKKENKFDMSNLDIKRDIAIHSINYSKSTSCNCTELIIDNSKDKNGTIDLNFALKLAQTLNNSTEKRSPEEEIPNLAQKLKQNPFC